MSPNQRHWLFLFTIIALVLLVDQVSKRIVVDTLAVHESRQVISALAPFFQITRSENRGSAFGFLPQAGDIFLILAFVIVIGMIIFFPRLPEKATVARIAFGLVCGGAMGNALDRLEYGAVVDFIHYTIPGVISNVSNLADHAIVVGVILLLLDSWRSGPEHSSAAAVADTPTELP
jgi:signal peptidase II